MGKVKHGMSKTRFYITWGGMMQRCRVRLYSTYCDRRTRFENFKEDMYESYLEHSDEHGELLTTIDRIDGTKGYSKENCRRATYKEQNRNRKSNIKYKGECMVDICKKTGLKKNTVICRLRRGRELERALFEPLNSKGRRRPETFSIYEKGKGINHKQ